jgi:hypothetical protein
MEWHIQFRIDGEEHIDWYPNPEDAIEAACLLIDDGGVGTGPRTDSIDENQIARIYALWARAKRPFGLS